MRRMLFVLVVLMIGLSVEMQAKEVKEGNAEYWLSFAENTIFWEKKQVAAQMATAYLLRDIRDELIKAREENGK